VLVAIDLKRHHDHLLLHATGKVLFGRYRFRHRGLKICRTLAQWKLAKIYANGDGVSRDDLRAYDYFSQIVSNKSGRVLLRHAAAKCRRYMAYFCTAAYIRPIESSNAP
jgi:hypothetical protein